MAETLYLRIPVDDIPASWLLVDALGNRIGRVQHGELTEAAASAKGRRVRVLVPGGRVTLLHARVPTRNLQKVLQAIPYALEDRLAEDIETLHFALGPRDDDGYTVAALRRSDLTNWLETLAAAGIEADEIIPDMLAVPMHDATLDLVLDANQLLVRLPNGSGFCTEPVLAPLLLERQLTDLRESHACDKAIVHAMDGSTTDSIVQMLEALNLEVQRSPLSDGVLSLLAATLSQSSTINLLQGEHARHKGMSEHWQRWRLAALLLAAFCVAGIAQQTVAYFQLRHEATKLDAQVLEQFHKALPDVHRVVDPRQQVEQRLKQLSGGGNSNGPLPMLMTLGTALQANSTVQLSGFSYQNGTLQVQVEAPRIQALDELKTALQQSGQLNVSLDSVNSNDGKATGRLTLTGNGP